MIWIDYIRSSLCDGATERVPERRRQVLSRPILITNEHFEEKRKLTVSQYWGTEGQETEIKPAMQ